MTKTSRCHQFAIFRRNLAKIDEFISILHPHPELSARLRQVLLRPAAMKSPLNGLLGDTNQMRQT